MKCSGSKKTIQLYVSNDNKIYWELYINGSPQFDRGLDQPAIIDLINGNSAWYRNGRSYKRMIGGRLIDYENS